MTLEQKISDAVVAQNALTQAVSNKMGLLDQRVEQFVSKWGVDGYTTLEVGKGKPFATILDAWNSLDGKSLKADVLIKVADGVYETMGMDLTSQPYAHRIRIEGNVGNPAACTIKSVPDANKQSHGLIFTSVRGVTLAGFKFIGEATATNFTHRSLFIRAHSQVWSPANSIVVEGGWNGLHVDQMSRYDIEGLRVSKTSAWAVVVGAGSTGVLSKLVVTGLGKSTRTTIPTHVDPYQATDNSHGLLVQDTSRCWAGESSITDVYHAYFSSRNAYLHCDGAVAARCTFGFYAQTGGVCWAHINDVGPNRPVALRASVTDADYGYFADWSGCLMVPGAIAQRCVEGFRASNGSTVYANVAYAENCQRGFAAWTQSMIYADTTNGKTSGTPTPYSPNQSSVPGNINAIVVFS